MAEVRRQSARAASLPPPWREAQSAAYQRHWPGVERALAELPARLFRQAKLLEYDLAIGYSDSGQFPDVFRGANHVPLPSIPVWLFDDLDVPAGHGRDNAEGHIFRAALFLALSSYSVETTAEAESFTGPEYIAIAQHLQHRATIELSQAIPAGRGFWTDWRSIETDQREHWLELRDDRSVTDVPTEPAVYLRGSWSAIARIISRAALSAADRDELASEVASLLVDTADALEIRDGLATLAGDLERAHRTYPIALIARAAGIPLEPWPGQTEMLGATIATGSLVAIREAAQSRLHGAYERAMRLGLATFGAYLEDAEIAIAERLSAATGALRLTVSQTARAARPRVQRSDRAIEQALAMAEGFLVADPEYKEAWETHREGMFGTELVASHYPAAMVIEVLGRHGHHVRNFVDAFQKFTVVNAFRYFDHPMSGVDTDTLGGYLRLCQYASDPAAARVAAGTMLDCLERSVREHGVVPVWLDPCDRAASRDVLDLGEGCATVAAHLLLGLSAVDSFKYRDMLEIGARDVLTRILDSGLGANVNYPQLYALGTFLRLINGCELAPDTAEVERLAVEARAALLGRLNRAVRKRVTTAQDAALLVVACLEAQRPELIDPEWIRIVLRQQRFDGSWRGEPFFAAPNRGRSVTWYESALVTSAVCYDALVRSSGGARREGHPDG